MGLTVKAGALILLTTGGDNLCEGGILELNLGAENSARRCRAQSSWDVKKTFHSFARAAITNTTVC